jgi:heme-degrading monooxygenase HmoA
MSAGAIHFILIMILLSQCRREIKMQRSMEVVIYVVRREMEVEFPAAHRRVRDEMSRLPGFVSAETLRSVDAERTYVDLWTWDSVENARSAHRAFAGLASAEPFLRVVESVSHSGHYAELEKPG